MTHSICCLSAHSRSLKDSVTLTSSDPQTNWNVPYSNFIHSRHVFQRLLWFLPSSVCLSVSLHLLLSVCWSNSNKSVPPHSLLLQLVIHPSLLNVLLCLTKRRRQTSWSCDMNTFSHQIPSRLNIIRWLIDHLSFLFFNCQYKVFFPPLRVSFRDRSMTWNPAWGYGTVLFSSNESGQISAALLDCLPEFSQCQFLDFFSAYSLSSVCYQHLALQLSKGDEMVTQCSAYS